MSIPSDAYYGSPRSPFSPTLDSIQEVFEYEPLEETSPPPTPLTPLETPHAVSPFILPEAATLIAPTLFRGEEIEGIFSIPRKSQTAVASFKVANVLRRVLEADRLRRRRALRIYLKAIVFLKLLLKSHERGPISDCFQHSPRSTEDSSNFFSFSIAMDTGHLVAFQF
jgi:hypothetical protein